MKIFKTLCIAIVLVTTSACNQSFSDKEKEMLQASVQDAVEDINKEETSKVKEPKASYSKPFCELLTVEVVKSVYPDASDFIVKEGKEKRPECEINFMIGTSRIGIRISGQHPRENLNDRTFLEGEMEANKEWTKIDGLADEAYLFPNKFAPTIIVMKDGLRYYFQLTKYANPDTNNDDAVAMIRMVMQNA
jgi:hypothetical protein